jgi:fucose permease
MVSLILLVIIYAAYVTLGLPDSLLGAVWPSMCQAIGAEPHLASYVSMIIAAGTVISSICSHYIISKFGTGLVAAISILLTAVSMLAVSILSSYVWLCILALPLGMGAGAVDAALNNYLALNYKAMYMNWAHCMWGVGAFIAPLITAALLEQNMAWNASYMVIGTILAVFSVLMLISLPLWKKVKVSKTTFSEHSSTLKEHYAAEKMSASTKISLLKVLRKKGVRYVAASLFAYFAIETTAALWCSSFLTFFRGIEPQTAARWIAFFFIGITFGRFVSGFVSIKLNDTQMIALGQVLIACGTLLLLLPIREVLMPALFVIGLGCAPIYPSLLHSTPAHFGASSSQAVMAVQMTAAYTANTAMPLLFGALAAMLGFWILPLFLLLAVLILKIMLQKMQKSILKENINIFVE